MTDKEGSGKYLKAAEREAEEIREFLEQYTIFLPPSVFYVQSITESGKPCCSHSWKLYRGFTEEFEYCEHCDTRR